MLYSIILVCSARFDAFATGSLQLLAAAVPPFSVPSNHYHSYKVQPILMLSSDNNLNDNQEFLQKFPD